MQKYLENLNPEQKRAVLHTEGPLLILAGAGAGKTKTLTHRIIHLINQGVEPNKILAITFTNKAAKEMKERVLDLIEKTLEINQSLHHTERPFISTFHTLGVYILKHHGEVLGIPRSFTIFDRNDSKSAIKKSLQENNYDPKQYEPGKILSRISKEKSNMMTPETFEVKNNSYMDNIVLEVWKTYEKFLEKEKALDFDDLLLKAALILQKNPEVRNYYQNKWQYLHIDEYQDTNEVQYLMATILAEKHHNVCAIGDIDQNIYSWRGATIRNILNFEKEYPETTEIVLEKNYRSTKNILGVANDIIKLNTRRKEKNLYTENEDGELITLYNAFDANDEANYIVDEIRELINDKKIKPDEIAILFRANFQSRVLEEAFIRKGVPYQLLGTKFFDRKEVKDVLAYIKSSFNPDDFTNLTRAIQVPSRGIGKIALLKILENKVEDLPARARESFYKFNKLRGEIRELAKTNHPSIVVKYVIEKSGLEEFYKKGTDGAEKLENIRELVSIASKYDIEPQETAMETFLEETMLQSDQDEMDDKEKSGVKLMTVHASKGLEFDYVFISGLEEGLFPHERMDQDKNHDDEEERRLFYVAITRARKKLYMTYAGIRTIFGSQQVNVPSSFLEDIDEAYLEYPEDRGDGGLTPGVKEIFIDF